MILVYNFYFLVSAIAVAMRPSQDSLLDLAGIQGRGKAHGEPEMCGCEDSHLQWKKPTRIKGKCIFIDLGANDGGTFQKFFESRGDLAPNGLAKCSSNFETRDYEAFLVEANPRFDSILQKMETAFPGVHALNGTAVFRCGGNATFYAQTIDQSGKYWGGRLVNHEKAQSIGKVTVPRVNFLKLLSENTIPEDHVVVKMDIEGSEFDILPCLADSPLAEHVDSIYIETHSNDWSVTKPGLQSIWNAEDRLVSRGVEVWDWSTHFEKRSGH